MRFLIPIISRYSAIAIQFFIVFLVARKLPLDEAGLYFSIFGFVLTTNYTAGFGLPDGVVKEYPALQANEQHTQAKTLLESSLSIGLFSAFAIAVVICAALYFYGNENYLYIGLWWLSYALIFIASQVLVASGRAKTGTFVFYSAINFSLLLITVPYLLIDSAADISGVFKFTVISGLLAAAVSLFWVFRTSALPGFPRFEKPLFHAWNNGIAIAFGRAVQAAIIWSPVWLSGALINHEASALVGLATRLVSSVAAIIAAVRFSIRPRLAAFAATHQWDEIARSSRNIAFWATALAVSALIGDLILGRFVIATAFGENYASAYILVAIFLIATIGESFGGPVDEVLKMSGGARLVLKLQIGFGLLAAALQYLLAQFLGADGVALGYAIGFAAMYAAMIYALKSIRGILLMPAMPRKAQKVMLWLRYFRYISPVKIIKKILHERLSRKIAKDPSRFLRKDKAVGTPFSNPALLDFASIYKAQGDRFIDCDLIYDGTFRVKGLEHQFGTLANVHWNNPFANDPSKLHWSHDLAFFSFTLPLVQHSAGQAVPAIATLVEAMEREHPVQSQKLHFVWTPIALSLRLLGLCSAMALARRELGGLPEKESRIIAEHVALCSAILDLTAERYLGYNHHVFAETALAVARTALNQPAADAIESAVNGIERHLLEDGFWSERSPSYHIHMLLLLRAMAALNATSPAFQAKMADMIALMTGALDVVVHPDGEIAILNDAAIEDSVPPAAVGWLKSDDPSVCKALPQTGYVKLAQGGTSIIFDAGPMGPNDVIGHGHADFLSAQISIGEKRLFVDPGVASITNDEKRRWTRSSEFHNGPRYEGLEPAEFFGAWRVGFRGKAWLDGTPENRTGVLIAKGTCNGFAQKAGLVSRKIELARDGTVSITDSWEEKKALNRKIATFLIEAGWSVTRLSDNQVRIISDTAVVDVAVVGGCVITGENVLYYPYGPLAAKQGQWISMSPDENLHQYTMTLTVLSAGKTDSNMPMEV